MVINYFNFVSVIILPPENYSPLIIYSYAEKTTPISF